MSLSISLYTLTSPSQKLRGTRKCHKFHQVKHKVHWHIECALDDDTKTIDSLSQLILRTVRPYKIIRIRADSKPISNWLYHTKSKNEQAFCYIVSRTDKTSLPHHTLKHRRTAASTIRFAKRTAFTTLLVLFLRSRALSRLRAHSHEWVASDRLQYHAKRWCIDSVYWNSTLSMHFSLSYILNETHDKSTKRISESKLRTSFRACVGAIVLPVHIYVLDGVA